MTFANSIIAYSALMVGSRLPLINFEVECFGLAGFGLGVLATNSVGQEPGLASSQNAYSVSSCMGNLIHKIKAAKVLVLLHLVRVASGLWPSLVHERHHPSCPE